MGRPTWFWSKCRLCVGRWSYHDRVARVRGAQQCPGSALFEQRHRPRHAFKRWISTFAYPDTAGRSQQHRWSRPATLHLLWVFRTGRRCNPGKRSRPSPTLVLLGPLHWDCWDPAGDGGGWRRKRDARRGSPGERSYGRTLVRRGGRRSAPQPNRGSLTWNWLQLGGGAFSTPLFSSGSLAATPAGDGILSLDRYMWLAGEPSDITATPEPAPWCSSP